MREYKSPSTGLLLELIGWLGFLGIGHIWAGKTIRGILLMIGYWVFGVVLVLGPVGAILAGAGVGSSLVLMCVLAIVWILLPLGSGIYLRNELQREQGTPART